MFLKVYVGVWIYYLNEMNITTEIFCIIFILIDNYITIFFLTQFEQIYTQGNKEI